MDNDKVCTCRYIYKGKFVVYFTANMNLSHWTAHSFSRRGGDKVKKADGGIIILARCRHHFIRVYANLEQHPSILAYIFTSWLSHI